MRERWGAFSVRDHVSNAPFVSEVLLYDRLVIPVPDPEDKMSEASWTNEGWKPELLHECLDVLKVKNGHDGWAGTYRSLGQFQEGAVQEPDEYGLGFGVAEPQSRTGVLHGSVPDDANAIEERVPAGPTGRRVESMDRCRLLFLGRVPTRCFNVQRRPQSAARAFAFTPLSDSHPERPEARHAKTGG